MARKPIQHEIVGLQTPRERVWRAARKLREFSILELQDHTQPLVQLAAVKTYVQLLMKAGFLAADGEQGRRGCKFDELRYRVVNDSFDAPKVTRKGATVVQGMANLAMWRAMKVLRVFDHHDVQRAASTPDFQVSEQTAKSYVNALARAGYFQELSAGKSRTAARLRMVRDTGAHAPAITRRKAVFDRNLGDFTWQQTPQEVCDDLE